MVDLQQAKRDLLKANFNPNTRLNKLNPDPSQARLLDKSDLLAYTTEFNLVHHGASRIMCAGRVADGRGRLLACRILAAQRLPDRTLRLTTQREFAASDLGDLDLAGDESAPRSYGEAGYVSESGGIDPTFGHRLLLAGFMDGDSSGVALQTWPEPHTVAPASYDGQLRLATLETRQDAWGPSLKFLARWERDFDASYSGGGGNLANVAPLDARQPEPENPLWDMALPGTLYPDGIYVEKDCQPGYACQGNLHGTRGVLSIWVKPGYDVTRTPTDDKVRGHLYLNNHRVNPSPADTACFQVANLTAYDAVPVPIGGNTPFGWGLHWENGFDVDNFREQARSTRNGREVLPCRWYLLTCFWDIGAQTPPENAQIRIDRGLDDDDRQYDPYAYGSSWTIASPSLVDFTDPDILSAGPTPLTSPARFYLGIRGNFPAGGWRYLAPPDTTFDELAIYDFGPAVTAVPWMDILALSRYEAGRYYKEPGYAGIGATPSLNTAGRYLSAPIDLGRAWIRSLAWTQVVPPGATAKGRILLELADASGTAYVADASGTPIDTAFTASGGQSLNRAVGAPFRLHAVFQPLLDPATMTQTPILDPLALDDISVTYRLSEDPLLAAWREE
jgi:hypothetical protein